MYECEREEMLGSSVSMNISASFSVSVCEHCVCVCVCVCGWLPACHSSKNYQVKIKKKFHLNRMVGCAKVHVCVCERMPRVHVTPLSELPLFDLENSVGDSNPLRVNPRRVEHG